jgi:hypothetical protein
MSDVTKTVKLTRQEWIALVMNVIASIGRGAVENIIISALGEERGRILIDEQQGPALSKADNRRIIQELYKVAPGDTRDAKITWAIKIAQATFLNADRFAEVFAYVYSRVSVTDLADPVSSDAGAANPDVADAADVFLWEPREDSVFIRIPRSLPFWQFTLSTLSPHEYILGPMGETRHEILLPGSGAHWAQVASNANPRKYSSIMVYINTTEHQATGHNSAGWRILDPTRRYEGDSGTRLQPGENK